MTSKKIWDKDVSTSLRPQCGPRGLEAKLRPRRQKETRNMGLSQSQSGLLGPSLQGTNWLLWRVTPLPPNPVPDTPPTDCQPKARGTSLGTFALKYCLHMVGKLMSLFLFCVLMT